VNSWSGGYTVSISVQNISDVPVVVSASVPIPPPDLILQAWNVMVTTSGSTAWLRPWNPILQPGQTLYFGYLGMGRYVPPTVVCQPLS
jgi:hypothetical protein